ncbi:hypothetical protein ACN47E_003368 [Coniothyrium glycines]
MASSMDMGYQPKTSRYFTVVQERCNAAVAEILEQVREGKTVQNEHIVVRITEAVTALLPSGPIWEPQDLKPRRRVSAHKAAQIKKAPRHPGLAPAWRFDGPGTRAFAGVLAGFHITTPDEHEARFLKLASALSLPLVQPQEADFLMDHNDWLREAITTPLPHQDLYTPPTPTSPSPEHPTLLTSGNNSPPQVAKQIAMGAHHSSPSPLPTFTNTFGLSTPPKSPESLEDAAQVTLTPQKHAPQVRGGNVFGACASQPPPRLVWTSVSPPRTAEVSSGTSIQKSVNDTRMDDLPAVISNDVFAALHADRTAMAMVEDHDMADASSDIVPNAVGTYQTRMDNPRSTKDVLAVLKPTTTKSVDMDMADSPFPLSTTTTVISSSATRPATQTAPTKLGLRLLTTPLPSRGASTSLSLATGSSSLPATAAPSKVLTESVRQVQNKVAAQRSAARIQAHTAVSTAAHIVAIKAIADFDVPKAAQQTAEAAVATATATDDTALFVSRDAEWRQELWSLFEEARARCLAASISPHFRRLFGLQWQDPAVIDMVVDYLVKGGQSPPKTLHGAIVEMKRTLGDPEVSHQYNSNIPAILRKIWLLAMHIQLKAMIPVEDRGDIPAKLRAGHLRTMFVKTAEINYQLIRTENLAGSMSWDEMKELVQHKENAFFKSIGAAQSNRRSIGQAYRTHMNAQCSGLETKLIVRMIKNHGGQQKGPSVRPRVAPPGMWLQFARKRDFDTANGFVEVPVRLKRSRDQDPDKKSKHARVPDQTDDDSSGGKMKRSRD